MKKILIIGLLLCAVILMSGCAGNGAPQKIKDDDQWLDSTNAQLDIINSDADDLQTNPNDLELNKQFIADLQNAIAEDDKYIVTSKYEAARHEWQLALKDYVTAMQEKVQILNDGDGTTKTQIEHQNTVLDTATKNRT